MNVVIMVGASGSGKSHYVWEQVQALGPRVSCAAVSADNYFLDIEGEYKFDVSKLGEAHASCVREFVDLCQSIGYNKVFVDNTNTTLAEIAPYYALAKAYGHTVTVVRVQAEEETCVQDNQHGVPAHVIQAQRKRIEAMVFPPFWEITVCDVVRA